MFKTLRWIMLAMATIGLSHSVAQQESERDRSIAQLAKSNDPADQYTLAGAYMSGAVNGKRDEEKGFELLNKSAAQNYAPAEYWLGLAYRRGEGHPIDNNAAILWFRKAADSGFVLAEAQLGDMYSEGIGTSRDDR
jgi:TPR repeat protein